MCFLSWNLHVFSGPQDLRMSFTDSTKAIDICLSFWPDLATLRPWQLYTAAVACIYIYMIWYDMIFYDILIYWGFATASPLRSALIRRDPDAWANSLAATSLACLLSIWPRPCHFLGRHTRTVCISSGTWRWFQNRSVYVKSFGKWRGDTAGPLVQL